MTERSTPPPTEPCPSPSETPDRAVVEHDATTATVGPTPEDWKAVHDAAPAPPEPHGRPFIAPETLSLDSLPPDQRAKLQVLVRGGTTTSAYDKELQQRMADAEVRRAEADADKKIGQVPIEQGGGLVFEHKLADPMTGPRVLIKYVGTTKEVLMEQLCELVEDDTSGDSMFIFVCPECFRRGIPSGFCQCHVKAKHRAWHVDRRTAGQVLAAKNSDAPGGIEYYTSAGEIMDTDVLRCDNVNCGSAFKIHRNIMYKV